MGFMDTNDVGKATYLQSDLYGGVESADPHRLIEMLLDGLIKNLAMAKLAIESKETMKKCTAIDKALNILDALRNSLDFDAGGDLARNLDDLYDYLQRSLIVANLGSNPDTINEVVSLVQMIKEAWSKIAVGSAPALGDFKQALSYTNTAL